jgi:Arc/MetJ-type ribon-helix-helix transcriptional regulator
LPAAVQPTVVAGGATAAYIPAPEAAMDRRMVILTEDDALLATQLVAEGRYSSAEEVVQAAMDALRGAVEHDQTMDWDSMRAAAAEGEAAIGRGEYVELRSDKALKAHLDGIMARVEADAERGRRKQ